VFTEHLEHPEYPPLPRNRQGKSSSSQLLYQDVVTVWPTCSQGRI